MIGRSPTLWYATITVDKGSDDGVHVNDPVVGDGALVGKVTVADSTVSIVMLITDPQFAAAAQVQDGPGDTGVLKPRHRQSERAAPPGPSEAQRLGRPGRPTTSRS